jgi:hypothetical protein
VSFDSQVAPGESLSGYSAVVENQPDGLLIIFRVWQPGDLRVREGVALHHNHVYEHFLTTKLC